MPFPWFTLFSMPVDTVTFAVTDFDDHDHICAHASKMKLLCTNVCHLQPYMHATSQNKELNLSMVVVDLLHFAYAPKSNDLQSQRHYNSNQCSCSEVSDTICTMNAAKYHLYMYTHCAIDETIIIKTLNLIWMT